MTDVKATTDKIDAVLEGRCACGCGQKLDPDGPSQWFAGQDCQMRYLQARAIRPNEIVAPPRPPAPKLIPRLPLLPDRIRNAQDLAEAERQLREAVDQMATLMPTLWETLRPILQAAVAAFERLTWTLIPTFRRIAPIVEAHQAHRRRLQAAYRRHLHTDYHRRVLARRRKARR